MSCGTVFVTTTSSIEDSSINLGASADKIPCVANTYILYAPLSLRIKDASTKDLTSSKNIDKTKICLYLYKNQW